MLTRQSGSLNLGAHHRGRRPSRKGFFNAPWWLLLLWIAIFFIVTFLAGELG
jgi:hypothetical protein